MLIIRIRIKIIFISMALLNLASLCNRGFGQLANGLFEVTNETLKKINLTVVWFATENSLNSNETKRMGKFDAT